jgi:hypothetical protein
MPARLFVMIATEVARRVCSRRLKQGKLQVELDHPPRAGSQAPSARLTNQ